MSMCRRFKGAPVMRLIVSVPTETVVCIKALMANREHPARGCRAEFVRLAIAEKLTRDQPFILDRSATGFAPDDL